MCQSDIREDLCDEVIFVFILLLTPLDRYVTSHLLQEQQTAVHAKQTCMHSSHPVWWKPNCSLEFTRVPGPWSLKTTWRQILERLAPGQPCRALHRDPWLLQGSWCLDTWWVPLFAAHLCSLALLYYKKINNRFTPSHASDTAMAQHCLLAT